MTSLSSSDHLIANKNCCCVSTIGQSTFRKQLNEPALTQ